MDNRECFGNSVDAADMGGKIKRGPDGRVLNRSTAYAFTSKLPDELKSKVGTSLLINLTRLQDCLNEGGDRPKRGNGKPGHRDRAA